jgi:two-component system cell cycle sensor histidine kinase/response regulator CckA
MPEKRILIVEDERIVAEDLKRLLVKMGYGVTGIAVSGEEAIRSVQAQRPDLVLMDIRIEGPRDGIEVAEHLYAEYNVPVSYLTAFADAPTLDRAKTTMPFGYILKPFETRSLQAVIEMAIHRHMMESVISEMEGWHARALHSLTEAVFATDRDGRVIFMNKGAEKLSGWVPEALFGKPLSALITEVKEAPRPSANDAFGGGWSGVLQRKNGIPLPVTFSRCPLSGKEGEPDGDLFILKDQQTLPPS